MPTPPHMTRAPWNGWPWVILGFLVVLTWLCNKCGP